MDGSTTSSNNSNSTAPGGGANGSSTSAFLNLGSSPGGMGLFTSSGGSGGSGNILDSTLANSFASLGNGFSTSTGGGGDNSVPGGSSNPSFDLNDFPSLGGGIGGGIGGGSVGSGMTGSSAGDNGLAAALRQQQQLLQQQMMQGNGGNDANAAKQQSSNLYRLAMSSNIGNGAGSNFTMATEDFPALPGAAPGEGGLGGLTSEGGGGGQPSNEGVSFSGSGGLLDSGTQLDYTGLIGGVSGATSGVSTMASNSGSSALGQTRSTIITQTGRGAASSASGHAGSAIGGDYGLLGLLSVIRMTDADRNRLALGSDLTLLGLNLNSSDNLYSTFGGPFSDKPALREPHYQLPMCYYMQPPALKTGHLSKFQLETLFYIFYALPKDILQAYSAQELYTREWRYHAESKVWFKRASPSDGVPNMTNTQAGTQYIYFDINTWERRMYGNVNQNIAGGFLPEEDVRVKFPSS